MDGEKTPEDEVFKKVDGKWLPAKMVEQWDAQIAEAKGSMGNLAVPPEQKLAMMGILASADQLLDKLLAAKDQAAFDGEIGMALLQYGPMMSGFGGGGAMSGPSSGLPTGSPGGALPTGSGPAITLPLTPPTPTPPTPPKTP
jgi:hypothetical protein